MVNLELLYSAKSHADLVQIRSARRSLPTIAIDQVDFERAEEVMELLARRGHHRAAGLQDLLIAAVAERARLCVLHYDADFDVIAAVTGQDVEWVVPRGTVP